jgi:arylsulfatase A-like enzyme
VGLIDIVPTLFELLGIEDLDHELDGWSLLIPALAPREVDGDRPLYCSVLSQKARQGRFFRRSVRSGDRHLVHRTLAGEYELYDTRQDRAEKTNLVNAPEEVETLDRLKRQLAQSLTGNLATQRLVD